MLKIKCLFMVFYVHRDSFNNHDPLLLFYVSERDQCTIYKQFYNAINKDKYNAKNIYLIIKYH